MNDSPVTLVFTVDELEAEGKMAIESPSSPVAPEFAPESFLMEENEERLVDVITIVGAYYKFTIQLNPALTDFRGQTNFICFKWNSVIANIRNKRKLVMGTMDEYLL